MPSTSESRASEHVAMDGYEGSLEELDGYTVAFETYTKDADLAPYFEGLPDDRCQSAHVGYVLSGRVTFTFADGHAEDYVAGDAYHAPPGHTPTLHAGTRLVEFSPTEQLRQTIEVVSRNMERAGVS